MTGTSSGAAAPDEFVVSGHRELMSRSVQLRPLLRSDQTWCYLLMCGPAGERFRYRGRTPSPEVVEADLWRNVHTQFVVTDRSSGRPVGLVGFYNAALEASRCHAFAVGEPDAAPLVTEGFGLLCAWGFDHLGWQRIFLEVPEFNAANFASLGDAAVVEGRLRNYEVWNGRFWDLLIVSISAESFAKRCGGLLESRQGNPPAVGSVTAAELTALVDELWPFDSLGWVELLNAVEDYRGEPVASECLTGIDADSASGFSAEMLRRVEAVTPVAAL